MANKILVICNEHSDTPITIHYEDDIFEIERFVTEQKRSYIWKNIWKKSSSKKIELNNESAEIIKSFLGKYENFQEIPYEEFETLKNAINSNPADLDRTDFEEKLSTVQTMRDVLDLIQQSPEEFHMRGLELGNCMWQDEKDLKKSKEMFQEFFSECPKWFEIKALENRLWHIIRCLKDPAELLWFLDECPEYFKPYVTKNISGLREILDNLESQKKIDKAIDDFWENIAPPMHDGGKEVTMFFDKNEKAMGRKTTYYSSGEEVIKFFLGEKQVATFKN